MAKDTLKGLQKTPRYDKYIVAIGASAGGLEAIHAFFDHMPESSSFSFVVIQHLSSNFKSLLVELVSKHTHMKVFEAAHDMAIQQDCVYIIPNNKLMTVNNGRLKLADKSLIKAPNTAIDTFLHTLAEDKKEKAVAIILSGTGTDGTKGIQSIKDFGGMVIVQDPATAQFDGMPNSAIASGNADFILPPERIHEALFEYNEEDPVKVLEPGQVDDGLLEEVFKLVLSKSGNDFNLYKTATIIRRISRRMADTGHRNLAKYIEYLHGHPEEVDTLGQDFLIGVTRFFRDKQCFELLKTEVLPALIESKAEREVLKIWVCACSTGQEAYSIAILVNECLEKMGRKLDVKIFATDIDEQSIEIAAANQYPANISKEIDPKLLKKYFIQEGKSLSVISQIRKQIVFAKHDVIKSPPFIKNDLISCRNMLIYMNNILQDKVLSTFHFSLNPNGYMLLGSSETANAIKSGLKEISGKWKLYQKSGKINYSSFNTYNTGGRMLSKTNRSEQPAREIPLTVVEKRFNKFITADLGYAGVFVDKAYIIQETVGNYRHFLSLPEKIELNILRMVPKEISVVLNTALRKVWNENRPVHINRLRIHRGEESIYLNVSIQPPQDEDSYTMVIFSESIAEIIPDKEDLVLSALSGEQHSEYIYELEAELNETRNNLQLAIEEMETTNEELQSTNEELLSANEELQSSNEELQSLNEELHTLNTEHQIKIKELVDLNDDLDNYFRSTDIGQIFLDTGLYIRKFNPAAISMVNLIDADIGRSIDHISNNIKTDNLSADIRSVLLSGHIVEKEVTLKTGDKSLMRIMPYIRKDKQKDGVVITFVDVSHIADLNSMITGVFNASLNGILAFTSVRNHEHLITDFKCISYNDAALQMLHKSKEELKNALLVKQLPELTEGNLFQKYINTVEKGSTLEHEFKTADERWYRMVAVKMSDGFAATLTDYTDQKGAAVKLKKNYNELIGVRESLKKLNTDLEIKIQERTQELSESEERFKQVSRATNDTIWDWNMVNNEMWRSDNFTSMFGYQLDENSSNINFWFEKIHPDDTLRVKDSVFKAINTNQKQWSEEYRLKKSDGSYAIILDRGTIMLDDSQTPYRMVGSMVDITRLIDAEQRVRKQQDEFYSIFKSAPALISIRKGPELKYEFVNNAFIEFNGNVEPKGDSETVNFFNVDANIRDIEKRVLSKAEAFEGRAHHYQRTDPDTGERTEHWLDYVLTPVYSDEGLVDGIAFFGFEVTDLLKAQQATKELMQRKDEFMSIASHELKTPITSIQGFLQLALRLAQKSEGENPMLSFIEKANRQLGNLTSLVSDLLDVTKIQAGKMQFNFSRFNIKEVLEQFVDDIVSDADHEILSDHADDVEIYADKHRIEQVLHNFVSNAIKYSPNNKTAIIHTRLSGEQVRISVKDFGIGIPESKVDHVFDRFFRVQDAHSMISGLGLGLYISAEIVKRHGGTIGVNSKEHEGSEFWFEIPLKRIH